MVVDRRLRTKRIPVTRIGAAQESRFDVLLSTLPRSEQVDTTRAHMPRVLIPSENGDFAYYLADAYRQAGWEAVVGAGNFDLFGLDFDLVHIQWPEELCYWAPPTDARLREIEEKLRAWSDRAVVAVTVHNLRPHRDGDDPRYARLYDLFYRSVDLMVHFSRTSHTSVLCELPETVQPRQLVAGYFNLDRLLPKGGVAERSVARSPWQFRDDEFVVLVFGRLREWGEVTLIRDGFDQARTPRKRLLVCGRFDESAGKPWQRRLHRWQWQRWLKARRADSGWGFVPDAEVHRLVSAADAVLIPRRNSLNSGLPALAASFGKIVIAPRCGAYPELLAGTDHPTYAPGDAGELAAAIDLAATLERSAVAEQSRRLAAAWQWSTMIERITAEVNLISAEKQKRAPR